MPKKRFFVCPLNLKARDQMREHKNRTEAFPLISIGPVGIKDGSFATETSLCDLFFARNLLFANNLLFASYLNSAESLSSFLVSTLCDFVISQFLACF